MNEVAYRVGYVRVFLWVAVFAFLAWLCSSHSFTHMLWQDELPGKLRILNGLPPEVRVVAAYVVAALFAVLALAMARYFLDTRMVIIDDEGITVRHPLKNERGYWSEFSDYRLTGWGGYRSVQLRFAGQRGRAKVNLPMIGLYGLDLRAIMLEAMIRAQSDLPSAVRDVVRNVAARHYGVAKSAPETPPAPAAATRTTFGRRAAEAQVATRPGQPMPRQEPVIQEGRPIFGRRPAAR